MSVYKKLMDARIALQGKELKKSGHNKFAGYDYFELGDFLPVVQQIFAELGLCGVISYGKEEATLTIIDIETGSEIVIRSPMSEAALKGCHPVQNLGAVETYTRRYLWVTALEIVEHDALDATTGKGDKKGMLTSTITPTTGAIETQTEDMQIFLHDLSREVVALAKEDNIKAAHELIEQAKLDTDAKVSLWAMMAGESKVRSALKAYAEKLRQAA